MDAKGRIQALFDLWALKDSYLIESHATDGEALKAALEKFVVSDKVELVDRTEEYALFWVLGPKGSAVLEKASSAKVVFGPWETGMQGTEDSRVRVARTDDWGIPCFRVWCPAADAQGVSGKILAAGQDHGLALLGWEALSVLRVEAGVPLFGGDVDGSLLPKHEPLHRVVSGE